MTDEGYCIIKYKRQSWSSMQMQVVDISVERVYESLYQFMGMVKGRGMSGLRNVCPS